MKQRRQYMPYAFYVAPASLEKFLEKVREGDDMEGNHVLLIKDLDNKIMVVIDRCYYPFIINNLRELERMCSI